MMIKHKRNLREDLSIIFNGIREFDSILPGQMRHVILNAFFVSLIPYVSIFMAMQIINELVGAAGRNRLIIYVAITICVTLVLTILSSRLQSKISVGYSQLFSSHEIRLNEKAYDLPYEKLEDTKIQELRDQVSGSIDVSGAGMGSLYWDMETLSKSFCSAVIATVMCVNVFLVSAPGEFTGIFAVVNSPYAVLILTALIIISATVSSKMTSKLFDVMFEVFKNGAKYNRYANYYMLDYLSDNKSAKDVRFFSQKKLILDETQKRCYIPFRDGDKRQKQASNKYNGITLLLSSVTGGAVYLLIGMKALSGTLGIGSVVMTYSAVTMLISALSNFFMTFTDLRNNNEHLKLYFEYINMPNRTDTGILPVHTDTDKGLDIKFENVSFKYLGTDNYVLRDVSFTIPQGKKLAIVGVNGSGKTTLIKLLCGLFTPTEGRIMLNGESISSYKYSEYASLFSVVFQDFRLLSFSIGQNVATATKYDESRVINSLQISGFGTKLGSLEHGINKALYSDYEDDGINLSGGEEQKVAIARAIYKNAPIFVLDEPTAALDPVAEYEIYQKFNEITSNRTTVFISHRLSSCQFCDEIAVIDEGKIIQWGSHDKLVAEDGKYRELWIAQAQHYTDK